MKSAIVVNMRKTVESAPTEIVTRSRRTDIRIGTGEKPSPCGAAFLYARALAFSPLSVLVFGGLAYFHLQADRLDKRRSLIFHDRREPFRVIAPL